MKQNYIYKFVSLLCILLLCGINGISQNEVQSPSLMQVKTETANKELPTVEPVIQEQTVVEIKQDKTEPYNKPKSSADGKEMGENKPGNINTGPGKIGSPIPNDPEGERSTANNHLRSNGDNHLNLNTGFLGVGTSSPSTKLHVYGLGNSSDILIEDEFPFLYLSSTTGLGSCGIQMNPYASTGGEAWMFYVNDLGFGQIGLKLSTGDTGFRPDLFIAPSGNVGIGTDTPLQKFHVNGIGQFDLGGGSINLSTPGGWPGFINFEPSNGWRRDIIFDGTGIRLLAHNGTTAPPNTNGIIINNNGNVGIGTDNAVEKLTVYGKVKATEFWATLTGWPDYVFNEDYNLTPLGELKQYIKENKHLPDIPTEEEIIENGVMLAEMDALIMKKIEELTLYIIEQQDQIDKLMQENEELKSLIGKEE